MSETTGTGTPPSRRNPGGGGAPGASVAHESYSFACLRCGHGWEQSYDIEHHLDAQGKEFVVYRADGRRVPSPLSQPTCDQCDGHVVRIMRPGRVSTVLDSMRESAHGGAARGRTASSGATDSGVRPARGGAGRAGRHLWRVPNLARLLHLVRRPH